MKQLLTLLISSALLTACGADSSTNDDSSSADAFPGQGVPPTTPPKENDLVSETHRVCNFVENEENDDVLTANSAIDESETWVLIESMTGAASDIDLDSIPENDQFLAAFASAAFLAPSFADIFSVLNSAYACSEEKYTENQCNWEIDFGETGSKVETVFGSNQSYTSTVSTREDALSSLQQSIVLQGTIGDLGNITLELYEEGINVGTRVATRSAGGTETVRWTSEMTNWVATETSSCTGSLEYEDIRESKTVTLNAQWTLGGTSTSGVLDYLSISEEDSASITINW
ncbi:conserved hypothetical protein [Oleispira antarctica RB-8]|uniref:Lipoprotein n=1 Tax=Oleispira antarctica RB-8 TaxID=698738 RepID=R4YLW4_OLEAN|nr:conserved hypothetical protein [Oleispira antarctica RB-8]